MPVNQSTLSKRIANASAESELISRSALSNDRTICCRAGQALAEDERTRVPVRVDLIDAGEPTRNLLDAGRRTIRGQTASHGILPSYAKVSRVETAARREPQAKLKHAIWRAVL